MTGKKADKARASSVPPGFCQLSLSHLQNTAFDRNVLIPVGGLRRFQVVQVITVFRL